MNLEEEPKSEVIKNAVIAINDVLAREIRIRQTYEKELLERLEIYLDMLHYAITEEEPLG